MAMPKKGSRSIIVDNVAYRWRIRRKATYCQSMGWTNMTVAVEAVMENDDTTALLINTSALRPDSCFTEEPNVSVTPAVVEAYIRQALANGWKPDEKGKPFKLVADAAMVTGKT